MKYGWFGTGIGVVVGLVATQARAQECQTDAQCGAGLRCEMVEVGGCPGAPPCGPDGQCPEPEPCTTELIGRCQPAPCQSDADCGDGMVCYTHQETECSGGAPCSSDMECEPVPEECVTTTEQLCVPRYVLPCASEADCGAGFACVPVPSNDCACTAPSPSDGDVDPDPDCGCETEYVQRCQLLVQACTTAGDCPDGFSCEDNRVQTCNPSDPPVCAPADPPRLCVPPYYGAFGGSALDDDGSTGGSPTRGESAAASGDDSGGCTVARPATGASRWTGLGAALGLLLLRRKRRAR